MIPAQSLGWSALLKPHPQLQAGMPDVFICFHTNFTPSLRPKSHILQDVLLDYRSPYESLPSLISRSPKDPHLLNLALC